MEAAKLPYDDLNVLVATLLFVVCMYLGEVDDATYLSGPRYIIAQAVNHVGLHTI